jgi:sigma-B regulation protein RsbU (phosphoserine phosphatase)
MSDAQSHLPADILLVDDTPENLRLLSQALAERGYGVRAVTSGARALESALAVAPDLILLDIRMPAMDGFEVCRRLKQDERTSAIPVIFISAVDEIHDKVEAFRAGGVDYITKPFRVEEVFARTETHLALRRLQARLEHANLRFARELALAGKLQATFLPDPMPSVPGWELAASLRPARETSGDFYDVLRLPEGGLGLMIADVVDKGVSAALLMAMSWSMLCAFAEEHVRSPANVLHAVNETLIRHLDGQQFLTAFYATLDPSSGQLTYCNAGHAPPLLIGGASSSPQVLPRTGPALGVIEQAQWEPRSLEMAPGDGLVMYTDGVTDAEGPGGEFFGAKRLERVVRAAQGKTANEARDAILDEVAGFSAGTPQFDDMAIFVLRRAPGSA